MAKKFAEITGIHKIFNTETPSEGQNAGKTVYTDMYITDSELQENIDENTIVFVTADNDDEGKMIGPNNYKISKDDCFIVAQNKVYATFGKVNVSDVMGPTGENGLTPHIDPSTGNWFIGTENTEVKAQGTNGLTPHIDPSTGNWFIGTENTEVKAQGPQGENGENGAPGLTPHIDPSTGNWFIGTENTEVKAQGPQGPAGSNVSMPVGSIIMFAGDVAPEGWLFCKGQVIPTIDEEGTTVLPIEKYKKYQTLVSVIKDSYNAYDILNQGGNDIESGSWINIDDSIEGQTVANLVYLPDFSLRFPYGASDTLENSYLDNKIYGGESSVVVPLPKHKHEYKVPSATGNTTSTPIFTGSLNREGTGYVSITNTAEQGADISTINIIPPYTMINFIIKY